MQVWGLIALIPAYADAETEAARFVSTKNPVNLLADSVSCITNDKDFLWKICSVHSKFRDLQFAG